MSHTPTSSQPASPSTSTPSIPPTPFPGPDGLPSSLSTTLSSVLHPGHLWYSDSCSLPLPGLSIAGLPDHLALPLTEHQAAQLEALDQDPLAGNTSNNSLCIPPDKVQFCRPDWDIELDYLCKIAVGKLGLHSADVQCVLDALFLNRAGDCFAPFAPADEDPDLFATILIQLPSEYKGGELVFSHDGKTEWCRQGADDGLSRFKSFYSVSYAHVQRELKPIESGFRLTLQYKIVWLLGPPKPVPSVDGLAEFANALQGYVDYYPAGNWHLAFELAYEYDSEDLLTHGIFALYGEDWRNVNAFSTAAMSIGIPGLDFVICKLVWVEDHDSTLTDGSDQDLPTMKVKEAVWKLGAPCSFNMNWVDWDSVVDLSYVHHADAGNGVDGNDKEKPHTTNAVVLWAEDRDAESLFKSDRYSVRIFLDNCTECKPAERASRMLGCLERRGPTDERAWPEVCEVLDFCHQEECHEEASRAIMFASRIPETEDFEGVLFCYIRSHGWDVVADACTHYLCNLEGVDLDHIGCRLRALFQLYPSLPNRIALDSLSEVIAILESHWMRFADGTSALTFTPRDCNEESLERWVPLMSIIGELELNSTDEELATLASIVDRTVNIIRAFLIREIKPLHHLLFKHNPDSRSTHLKEIREEVNTIYIAERAQEFERQKDYVVENRRAFRIRQEDDGYERFASLDNMVEDWLSFLSLCIEMQACDSNEFLDIPSQLEAIMACVEDLSENELEALSVAIATVDESIESSFLSEMEVKVRDLSSIIKLVDVAM